jgi:hypothetical protein
MAPSNDSYPTETWGLQPGDEPVSKFDTHQHDPSQRQTVAAG